MKPTNSIYWGPDRGLRESVITIWPEKPGYITTGFPFKPKDKDRWYLVYPAEYFGDDFPRSGMLNGVAYRGPRTELQGETATIRPASHAGYVLAQFDNLELPMGLTHGWTMFPTSDFLLTIDSAEWTGRRHWWRFWRWGTPHWKPPWGAKTYTLLLVKHTREDQPHVMRPVYGFGWGYDPFSDCRGIRLYWDHQCYWLYRISAIDDTERVT